MFFLLLLSAIFSLNETRTSKVVFRIEGLEDVKGEVRIAVFNSKATYAKEAFALAVIPVQNNVCEWEAPALTYGEYAVAVYHDANVNTKLDTNLVGIPVESYGFSNNARGMFGPPTWEKARIIVDKSTAVFSIHLK